jgi:hypothetical protein
VSIRRACDCLRVATSLYHYKSKRGDQAALKKRMKEIAQTRVRFGYRRIHVLLRREGSCGWRQTMTRLRFSNDQIIGGTVGNANSEHSGIWAVSDNLSRIPCLVVHSRKRDRGLNPFILP